MTDETHGDTPEEAPAPPTSTRWSEDAVAEDDAPPPPFVPGRGGPPAEATPGAEPAAGDRAPEGGTEPAGPEPFPFELPVEAAEREPAEAAAPEQVAPAEEEVTEQVAPAVEEEEAAAAATDRAEDDFPFEQFDIEGRGEAVGTPDRAGSAATAGSDPGGGWSPPSAPPAADSIEETATLLDRMADVLRSEGEAGVRRELDSPDRLTAVLAGILAGYLAGRS